MGANESRESDMGEGSGNNSNGSRRRSKAQDMTMGEAAATMGAAVATVGAAYGMYRLLSRGPDQNKLNEIEEESSQLPMRIARPRIGPPTVLFEEEESSQLPMRIAQARSGPLTDSSGSIIFALAKLNADASCKVKPENSSIGGLLRDSSGSIIFAYSIDSKLSDITQLELQAIYVGIEKALSLEISFLLVESDNQSAVNAINQKYTCPSNAEDLVRNIHSHLAKWENNWEVKHIRGKDNTAADYLADYPARPLNIPPDPVPVRLSEIVEKDCNEGFEI